MVLPNPARRFRGGKGMGLGGMSTSVISAAKHLSPSLQPPTRARTVMG